MSDRHKDKLIFFDRVAPELHGLFSDWLVVPWYASLSGKKFDTIVLSVRQAYVTEAQLVEEFMQYLRPGGTLICTTHEKALIA